MMAWMVTFTASMGELLLGMLVPVLAGLAMLDLVDLIVLLLQVSFSVGLTQESALRVGRASAHWITGLRKGAHSH